MKKYNNYIDGEWVAGADYLENRSPADLTDIVGLYARGNADDVASAVACARAAFSDWRFSALETRKSILDKIGNELIERSQEIGKVLAREEGKTLAEGVGEVFRSGQFFQYYAAETLRQMGEIVDSVRPGVEVEARREPLGVVGVITPWNFPMAVACWKIAPALAFGNSIVFKPADIVPASAWILAEIIDRSGLPKGVFNMVMGPGRDVGEAISTAKDVDAVTFTGSVSVGRRIAANVIQNMGKIQLEMGSKNALVVLNDADISTAVECAVMGGFSGTGQKCTASSRVIVESAVYDQFIDAFRERIQSLKTGHPLDEGVFMGSVASESQFNEVLSYIDLAKQEGATLVEGGSPLESKYQGFYLPPTLYVDTKNSMRINQEEIFGPVVCVQKASDYEHALGIVNDTEFGLTAGIITQSLAQATHFKHHAQSGCVMVNLPTAGTDYHVPFGGRKSSSYGSREQGSYAKEFYTVVKTNYSKAY